ncbi:MAG: M23 family metallopeptidase [Oscillospiraceae bacterium]|nr:M23 family metallopeptidase [Oscillospiraceae bacterium]
MSNNASRGTRHFFDGTGAYIALFLVVTALAVAGYWTLIPRTTADEPIVEDIPAPAPVKTVTPETVVKTPVVPKPVAPVQSTVELELPAEEPPAEVQPTPPVLIVDPLVGETVAAFSMDTLQYSATMGDWRTHDGVDIAADPGTQVCAASSGTVLDVRDDDWMGTTVVISHDGGYDTVYANLQTAPTVEVGDYVTAGQVIGSVGKTALGESAEPPHLHFAVTKDGEYVDPSEFLN